MSGSKLSGKYSNLSSRPCWAHVRHGVAELLATNKEGNQLSGRTAKKYVLGIIEVLLRILVTAVERREAQQLALLIRTHKTLLRQPLQESQERGHSKSVKKQIPLSKVVKFLPHKMESHSNFNCACSLSSIEIKITPLSDSNFLAIFNRLFMNESHLL